MIGALCESYVDCRTVGRGGRVRPSRPVVRLGSEEGAVLRPRLPFLDTIETPHAGKKAINLELPGVYRFFVCRKKPLTFRSDGRTMKMLQIITHHSNKRSRGLFL